MADKNEVAFDIDTGVFEHDKEEKKLKIVAHGQVIAKMPSKYKIKEIRKEQELDEVAMTKEPQPSTSRSNMIITPNHNGPSHNSIDDLRNSNSNDGPDIGK